MSSVKERARAYLQKVEPAVSGQGGHSVTFDAAIVLAKGFALPYGDAFPLLSEWNQRCSPPWTEKELERKLHDAYEKTSLPSGYLLGADVKPIHNYPKEIIKKPTTLVELPPPNALPDEVISSVETICSLFNEGELIRICTDAKKLQNSFYLKREDLIKQVESGQFVSSGINGALIGINPCNDRSGTDAGVSAFRHMLLECDKLPIEQQYAIIIETGLPVSAIIHSGNKSLHAWVKIDAGNKAEFDTRARKLFSHPLLVDFDRATKNAGRLTRMPGVQRGNYIQRVITLKIGANSFSEWEQDMLTVSEESKTQVHDFSLRFECLGYNGDSAYFLPHDTAQVAEIPLNKLSKSDALTRIDPDIKWWKDTFTEYHYAGAYLRMKCILAGVWSDSSAAKRLKGRGVWRDAGHIVLNTGNPNLIIDAKTIGDKWQSPSGFLYQRGDSLPIALDKPLTDEEALNFSSLLNLQAQHTSAGQILSGWVVNGYLLGILDFRPSVWIVGAKEVGKTHTRSYIAKALGVFCIDVSANTSEAHLRQSLGGSAIPFLFDESESDNKAGEESMMKVLGLCRAGCENDGQTVGKGGQNGNAISYRVRTCGLFSSIHPHLDRSRDASRFAMIELRQLPEDERTHRNLTARRLQHCTVDIPDFSARLAARVIRYSSNVAGNTRKLEEYFLDAKLSDREAKKWAAFLSGSVCLTHPEDEWSLTDESAKRLAEQFAYKRFTNIEKESDKAISRILSHKLPLAANIIPVTVGELLHKIRENLLTPDGASSEKAILLPMGLALTRQSGLIIQYGHNSMLDLFKVDPWNGRAARICDDLKQINGAEVKTMRVGEVRMKSVVLPLAVLDEFLGEVNNPF